jgi:hypothetical protein
VAERDVDQLVDRLVEIYGDAERSLRRVLGSADSTDFMRGRASRLLVQVEAIVRRLKVQSRRWAGPALTRGYREASAAIAQDPDLVAIAGGAERRPPRFDLIDRRAVEGIATAMLGDLDRAVDGIPRELNRIFLQTRQEAVGDVALLRRVARARVLGETREQLARDIAQTMRDGATERLKRRLPADVAERLRAIADGKFVPIVGKDGTLRRYDLKKYAELVGHTWMMAAANEAALRMAERFGTDLVQMPVHSGACPICRPRQGKVYSISGRHPDFPALDFRLPLHPHCFVAGTVVISPKVLAASTRWYEGPVCTIQTRSGHRFTVTPNHPLLSPKGWIAAGLLHKGSHVLRCLDAQRMTGLADPDHDHVPVMIEQVAQALRRSSLVAPVAMPVAAEDFHGDGIGSEICIVRSDGALRHGRDTEAFEPSSQLPLVHRDVAVSLLPSRRDSGTVYKGLAFSTHGGMRGPGVRAALLRCPRCRHETIRLDGAPDRHVRIAEATEEFGLTPPELLPELFSRFTGAISGDHNGRQRTPAMLGDAMFPEPAIQSLGANAESGADLVLRLAGLVTADEIVEVWYQDFRGHVYNLETVTGWYVANGIVAHNCRHRWSPVNEDTLRADGEYAALVAFSKSDRQAQTLPEYRQMLRRAQQQFEPKAGVHYKELVNTSVRTTEGVRALAHEAIERVDAEGFLKREPLDAITFADQLDNAFGEYDRGEKQRRINIQAKRPADSYGDRLVPFNENPREATWSMSRTAATAEGAILRTLVHELSHHLHLGLHVGHARSSLGKLADDVDALIIEGYDRAAAVRRAITGLATIDPIEYWTETHVAYIFERERLRQFDPTGLEMVRRVRALLGLADLG